MSTNGKPVWSKHGWKLWKLEGNGGPRFTPKAPKSFRHYSSRTSPRTVEVSFEEIE